MSDLDISYYSCDELLDSPNLQQYMDFINSCYLPLHLHFHTFTTARFADLDEFKSYVKDGEITLAVARDISTQDIVAAGGYKKMNDTEAELTCMSTDPRLGGKGIGTHMDKEIEKHARKSGLKKMHAMVIREHGRVVEFYERLGYAKKSEELIKPGGPLPNIVEVNVWYMDKDL
ncbi:hypothetical protein CJU90_0811 [Yarrowia sp. C11]|nr:hypothetical protein CKK34_2217 [Yarrowia sp. E02]KAG5373140.1 hypothetical protein CJU90_0811 [Yarrowia sp. C11]